MTTPPDATALPLRPHDGPAEAGSVVVGERPLQVSEVVAVARHGARV